MARNQTTIHILEVTMHYTAKYRSPLGMITLASDGTALTGLWFDGQKYFAATLPESHGEKELPIFEQTKIWLDIYFSGVSPDFTPPLSADGLSPFRKRVREIMLEIPFGQTTTYGKIAGQMQVETGKAVSAQAVGGAVGHNAISLIVPCHRVVGANGSLTGYAGGLDKKVKLLKLEDVDLSAFFIPARGTAL